MEYMSKGTSNMFTQLQTVENINALINTWERAATQREAYAMQTLLLGLNTTINHDLVFELASALSPECDTLTPEGRQRDRHMFEALIEQIKQKITITQARLISNGFQLEPALDTWVIEDLLEGWGESVWKHAEALLRSRSEIETEAIRFQVDRRTVKRADAIRHAYFSSKTLDIA